MSLYSKAIINTGCRSSYITFFFFHEVKCLNIFHKYQTANCYHYYSFSSYHTYYCHYYCCKTFPILRGFASSNRFWMHQIWLKISILHQQKEKWILAPIKIFCSAFSYPVFFWYEIKKLSGKNEYLVLLLSLLETCYACKSFKYAIRICNKTPSV